jgi:hypothetical protein
VSASSERHHELPGEQQDDHRRTPEHGEGIEQPLAHHPLSVAGALEVFEALELGAILAHRAIQQKRDQSSEHYKQDDSDGWVIGGEHDPL